MEPQREVMFVSGRDGASRRLLGLMIWTCVCIGAASSADAIDFKRRFWVGVRLGDYLPADEQKGGFRYFGSLFEPKTNAVSLKEEPMGTISIGYGVKQWKRVQMTLEAQVSRLSTSVGSETGYQDEDASTRVVIPPFNGITQNGDESFVRFPLGDLTVTPVFVNALFHWHGANNPERADFYTGIGLGVLMADFSESPQYRDFASDTDGDDVQVEDAFAMLAKLGANVRLAANKNWYLYFEAEFMSTGFLSSESQLSWDGVDYFAGQQVVDTDNDSIPETTVPADFRLIDPGHLRMDGAVAGIGLRYRFGKGARAASDASQDEKDALVDAPPPGEPAEPEIAPVEPEAPPVQP